MSLDDIVKKLSGNFPEDRKEGMEMMNHYFTFLTENKQELVPEHATQLWEGLFFAMWSQDKPLKQEALSKDISNLIHKLPSFRSQMVFLKTHYAVMSSHWAGLDKIRIDKFLMLVRDMLREAMALLSQAAWDQQYIRKFHSALRASVLDIKSMDPQVVFQFCDIFLVELKRAASDKLKGNLVTQMIMPFIYLIPSVPYPILRHFSSAIFDEEVWHVPRNFGKLAKLLFKRGSQEGVPKKNRKEIYKIVQRYRNLEKGLPARPSLDLDLGKDLDMDDVEEAAQRLVQEKRKAVEEDKLPCKKKKSKMVESHPNVIDLDYATWLEQKDHF